MTSIFSSLLTIKVCLLLGWYGLSKGDVRQCYSCRSRGKLGDCRDPFLYNGTALVPGVKIVPCASGWCSKTIDGDEHGEDHDLATERRCLQRPPPDLNSRCADAKFQHKKIFICFCQGSLCNSGTRVLPMGIALAFCTLIFTHLYMRIS